MEWIWDALKLLGAAVLGFSGGQLALIVDRRRKHRTAEPEWMLQALPNRSGFGAAPPHAKAWILQNVGTVKASAVALEIRNGTLEREVPDRDLDRNESEVIFVTSAGNGQLLISWTSHRGEKKGPVSRLLVPASWANS